MTSTDRHTEKRTNEQTADVRNIQIGGQRGIVGKKIVSRKRKIEKKNLGIST